MPSLDQGAQMGGQHHQRQHGEQHQQRRPPLWSPAVIQTCRARFHTLVRLSRKERPAASLLFYTPRWYETPPVPVPCPFPALRRWLQLTNANYGRLRNVARKAAARNRSDDLQQVFRIHALRKILAGAGEAKALNYTGT